VGPSRLQPALYYYKTPRLGHQYKDTHYNSLGNIYSYN